jgi:hypothetical protein
MTFLLFLVSFMVMKRVLSHPHARRETSCRSVGRSEIPTVARTAEPAQTLGLTALGQAINRHGRGQSPAGLPTAVRTSALADSALLGGKRPTDP